MKIKKWAMLKSASRGVAWMQMDKGERGQKWNHIVSEMSVISICWNTILYPFVTKRSLQRFVTKK